MGECRRVGERYASLTEQNSDIERCSMLEGRENGHVTMTTAWSVPNREDRVCVKGVDIVVARMSIVYVALTAYDDDECMFDRYRFPDCYCRKLDPMQRYILQSATWSRQSAANLRAELLPETQALSHSGWVTQHSTRVTRAARASRNFGSAQSATTPNSLVVKLVTYCC